MQKTPIPINYEDLVNKAQSKITPYFEIRTDSGALLVCANHTNSPKCNFKTDNIEEALTEIQKDGHQFVYIKFMSVPAERTNAQPYYYILNPEFDGEVNAYAPYWAKSPNQQNGSFAGAPQIPAQHYNQIWAQQQALTNKQESWLKEYMMLQTQQVQQHQQAMAGATEARIENTIQQRFIEQEKQRLEERYKDKEELLQQKYLLLEEKLKMQHESLKKDLDTREEKLKRIARNLKNKTEEIGELSDKNKKYFKDIFSALTEFAPNAIKGWLSGESKPLNGNIQEEKEKPDPEVEAKKKYRESYRDRFKRKNHDESTQEEEEEEQTNQ